MKDEYKVIIGVIIVALIILAGAYGLSGPNAPGAVTAGSIANGSKAAGPQGVAENASVPSTGGRAAEATPTPAPESGVRKTEFGYWITYPPLADEAWAGGPSSGGSPVSSGGSNGGAGSASSAYFPQASGSIGWSTCDPGNADIMNDVYPMPVTVKRTGTAGALSVSYTCSHTSSAYALPGGTVAFAAGSDTSTIYINVPYSSFIMAGSTDTITVRLDNDAQYTLHVN